MGGGLLELWHGGCVAGLLVVDPAEDTSNRQYITLSAGITNLSTIGDKHRSFADNINNPNYVQDFSGGFSYFIN